MGAHRRASRGNLGRHPWAWGAALSMACASCDRCSAPSSQGAEGTRDADPKGTAEVTAEPPSSPPPVSPPSEGARRPCDGSAPRGFRLARVAEGLREPLFVLSEPRDASRLYVLEKGGRVQRVTGNETTTLLTLPVKTDVEMGLLGMAFHPRFGEDERRVVVSYVDPEGRSTVSTFEYAGDRIDRSSERVLVRVQQPAPNHNGGMVTFGPDGWLYVGLGDGGGRDDQYGNGQNLATPLGAILRIDVDDPKRAVPGNRTDEGADPRIFHYGLRNPWRFSFDRETGDLYIGDVGQNHWEEIDVLPAGAGSTNFGWPTFEGKERCPGCKTNVPPPQDDMVVPVHTYPRGTAASVTGGYVYRGSRIPALRGRYLYSDFVHGWVKTFTWDGTKACDHHDLIAELGEGELQGVASFGEDSAGELYVVSFVSGEVYKLVPRE